MSAFLALVLIKFSVSLAWIHRVTGMKLLTLDAVGELAHLHLEPADLVIYKPKMPSKTVKAASSAPVRRSRTGCLTCRRRKLKCDEVSTISLLIFSVTDNRVKATPICGQCQKSRRQCDRSEGESQKMMTLRHTRKY